jgi:hypothetical protein
MATIMQKVSTKMIQAIEQEKLSTDHIIYYDIQHGWVCQQRDDILINSISKSTEQNTSMNLTNRVRPLEKLGPFGRFNISDNFIAKISHRTHIFRD